MSETSATPAQPTILASFREAVSQAETALAEERARDIQ